MDNTLAKISIVIPAYNAEITIERCIKSTLIQTYSNLEVIIIDDGSEDQTSNIVKRYCEKYPNIHYYWQKNSGVSSARNKGIEFSQGDYVMFLDSDDELCKETCSHMIKAIENFSADMVVCGFFEVLNSKITHQFCMESKFCNRMWTIQNSFEELFWGLQLNQPWNKLFRKDKIIHLFNIKKQNGEDIEFVLDFLKSGRQLIVLDECLYLNHIDNENSLSRNYKTILRNMKENHFYLLNYLVSEKINLYNHNISDYIVSQIWSNSLLGIKSRQFTPQQSIDMIEIEEHYLSLISHLKPQKTGNKLVRFLLIHRKIFLYKIFLRLLMFIK